MPFIGANDGKVSRRFYSELGFWLQKYYHKGWVNNSMIFLEIPDVELWQRELLAKELHFKYKYVRFTEIKTFDWGRELFMHDPSGILWHFCELNKEK